MRVGIAIKVPSLKKSSINLLGIWKTTFITRLQVHGRVYISTSYFLTLFPWPIVPPHGAQAGWQLLWVQCQTSSSWGLTTNRDINTAQHTWDPLGGGKQEQKGSMAKASSQETRKFKFCSYSCNFFTQQLGLRGAISFPAERLRPSAQPLLEHKPLFSR